MGPVGAAAHLPCGFDREKESGRRVVATPALSQAEHARRAIGTALRKKSP
jgi:hypothetical protein